MRQKGFASIVISILVILGGLGYFGYKYFQSNGIILYTPLLKFSPTPLPKIKLSQNVIDRAIKTAMENGFNASDLKVTEGYITTKTDKPNVLNYKTTIRIISCSLNKTMHLDPVTFEVLRFEGETWCGGVID